MHFQIKLQQRLMRLHPIQLRLVNVVVINGHLETDRRTRAVEHIRM